MTASCRQYGCRNASERGAALVEFAIVAPLLFLLLFGIIEYGFLFHQQLTLAQGARAAVRAASLVTSLSEVTEAAKGAVTGRVKQVLEAGGPATIKVYDCGTEGSACTEVTSDADLQSVEPGDLIEVRIEHFPYDSVTGPLMDGLVPTELTARMMMKKE